MRCDWATASGREGRHCQQPIAETALCRRQTLTYRGSQRICVMNVISYSMVQNVLEFWRCGDCQF